MDEKCLVFVPNVWLTVTDIYVGPGVGQFTFSVLALRLEPRPPFFEVGMLKRMWHWCSCGKGASWLMPL